MQRSFWYGWLARLLVVAQVYGLVLQSVAVAGVNTPFSGLWVEVSKPSQHAAALQVRVSTHDGTHHKALMAKEVAFHAFPSPWSEKKHQDDLGICLSQKGRVVDLQVQCPGLKAPQSMSLRIHGDGRIQVGEWDSSLGLALKTLGSIELRQRVQVPQLRLTGREIWNFKRLEVDDLWVNPLSGRFMNAPEGDLHFKQVHLFGDMETLEKGASTIPITILSGFLAGEIGEAYGQKNVDPPHRPNRP